MSPRYRFLLFLVFSLVVAPVGLAGRDVPVIAGTLIQCTVNEPNLSSRTAVVGDPVVCYARPLQEFGCSAFPRGTELAGRFVAYRNPGRLHGKGWIELQFDRLVLPGGQAPLSARVISVQGFNVDRQARILGHGHARRDAVGWAIPVLWPVKLATLPLRGPFPALTGERLVTLRLLDDVQLPCAANGGFTESLLEPWPSSDSASGNAVAAADIEPRYGVWRTFDGRKAQPPVKSTNSKPLRVESEDHTLAARGTSNLKPQ